MTFELTKEYVEHIQELIVREDSVAIRTEMEDLHSTDITGLLSELETENAKFVVQQLETETGAEILADMDPNERREFLKAFTSEEISGYVNLFDSDDAVDLLNEQPIRVREEVIALLEDREQARFILDLLHYDEDVAGGLMQKELIKANVNWTVNECIEEIRKQAEDVGKVYAVYVIEDNGKLLGILSLKKLYLLIKTPKSKACTIRMSFLLKPTARQKKLRSSCSVTIWMHYPL